MAGEPKMMKRTKSKKKRRREQLGKAAADAIRTITADDSQDWTIQDIAEEAKTRNLVPRRVYEEAQRKAVYDWLSRGGRRAKKNVGTAERPIMVREFGVYYVYEQTTSGEVKRPCWRTWEMMSRNERIDAVRHLFDMRNKMHHEAKTALSYVNRLEVALGRNPLLMDDVT
jgi:hypothetical protein